MDWRLSLECQSEHLSSGICSVDEAESLGNNCKSPTNEWKGHFWKLWHPRNYVAQINKGADVPLLDSFCTEGVLSKKEKSMNYQRGVKFSSGNILPVGYIHYTYSCKDRIYCPVDPENSSNIFYVSTFPYATPLINPNMRPFPHYFFHMVQHGEMQQYCYFWSNSIECAASYIYITMTPRWHWALLSIARDTPITIIGEEKGESKWEAIVRMLFVSLRTFKSP